MDNQSTGKFSRITNNFDDIDVKKINYIDSSLQIKKENENDIIDASPKKNISNYKNLNSQKMFSKIDKASDLFNIKSDTYKQVEERKNIDMEKTNINNYGFKLSDKLNHKKIDKNNIKDILSQNKKILSDITNIINNDNKNKKELNYGNVYYQNSFTTSQSNNLTGKENKNEENNSNLMNATNISKNENNSIRKTYFNYNEKYQKKMGGEDNYLENIEKYNKETNDKNIEIKYNNTDRSDNNIKGEKIISSSGLVFGKKDLNNVKTVNILKSKNDLDKKLDEKVPVSISSYNNYNKLIKKKEYNFNYRNDDSFNIINKTDTQRILNNYKTEIEPKLNNFLDNKKTKIETIKYIPSNEYYLKPDNDNDNINGLKYNNNLTNNDLKMENNDLLFTNSYNSSMNSYNFEEKERQIKLQIENEEKKLKQLEEEKNKLIKEEKERRQIIYNELSKRENSYKENNIDPMNLLEKNKRIEYQMSPKDSNNLEICKKYENLNTSQNENYYKDYLKEISNRNDLINKKTLEVINNNINKEKNNVNTNEINTNNKANIYEKINTNLTTNLNNLKKKSLSVNNRQIEIKDFIHNYSNGSNNKNFNIATNNLYDKTLKTINNINTYKPNILRYDSERKYNVNSYFQLKEKENTYISQPKPYYNNYTDEQSLSSYIDETNKENIINAHNKYYQGSLTPNGLYRNNKTDNNVVNTSNFRETPADNLLYNKNYYNSNNNEIIKTLSTNNYSTMTQTRFYRNRAFPDNNYDKDNDNYKLKTLNTVKDYKSEFDLINNNDNNFKKQNSTRSLFHLNFDLDKDFIGNSINYNYTSNSISQSSKLINDNNFKFNTLTSSNNIRNSNLYKSNKYTKSNSYRCKCTLRKGRSYNDITKLIEPIDNSISSNRNVNSLLQNFGSNNRGHDIANNLIKRNNYNNIVYRAFNQNNNSINYQNGNYRNICQKCAKRHYFNENNGNFRNIGNGFRNYNNVKLCNTCKKLFNELNGNKRNNRFLFG